MRRALPCLLVAATAHADPDPCTAAALHLTKVTEVAPVIVGASCHVRTTAEGELDVDRLHKLFPTIDHAAEQTLPITSAKQLAAAVTCDGALPKIDFTKNRAWIVVRDHLRSGSVQIVRAFDDGHTLLLADRTREGCTGGAVYTFARFLETTIVVAPADRTVERRVCEVPQPPCPQHAK
jgi:hypothetical protein